MTGPKRRDEGVALVTVLVMLSIVSALAILGVEAAGMSLRRTANQTQIEQSRWYLAGAEMVASGRIAALARQQEIAPVDQATWQGAPFVFPLDQGEMRVSLWDGGNCFNLNSVVERAENNAYVASARGQIQFARLLDILAIRDVDAGIVAALADWIDSDSSPLPGGAEDEAYATLDAPYVTAGVLLADISELRRVRGFTADVVARLSPFVCVRPTETPNAYNPNTMVAHQAPLLAMAMGADLSLVAAEEVIRSRPEGGWETIDAFFLSSGFRGVEFNEPTRAQFSTTTRYYVMGARVRNRDVVESGAALIDAQGSVRVVRRVFGTGAEQRIL